MTPNYLVVYWLVRLARRLSIWSTWLSHGRDARARALSGLRRARYDNILARLERARDRR